MTMVAKVAPVLGALVLLGSYTAGVWRLRTRGDVWPRGRYAAACCAALCIVVAELPPVASHDEDFRIHVTQHLLLAMAAPVLLALAAPTTLALRALRGTPRRWLHCLVRLRCARVLVSPAVAVGVGVGGLYGFYLSGAFALAEEHLFVHVLVHVHMFLAGCLISWSVLAPDPIVRRTRVAVRLAVVVVVGAAHDTLAKLLYAHDLPSGVPELSHRQEGAQLMYYASTLLDLAMAAIVMTQWWRASGRVLARSRARLGETYASSR
jgi:putative membrane protein